MKDELISAGWAAGDTCPPNWLIGLSTIPWDSAPPAVCLQATVSFLTGIGLASLALWREPGQDGIMIWDGSHLDLCLVGTDPLLAYLFELATKSNNEPCFLDPDRPVSSSAQLEEWLLDRPAACATRLYPANGPHFIIAVPPDGRKQASLALLQLLAHQSRMGMTVAARCVEAQDLAQSLAATQARILELAKSTLTDQTVNAIAHQLNNCLTSVLGYSQLLLETGVHSSQDKGYLQRIFTEAERMSHIVGNMLNFARRRNGGPELVDINELLHESVALQTYELEKHNIGVSLELDPDLPLTIADPYKMQIVFLNTLMNAHQAIVSTAERGRIVVRTAVSGEAAERIRIEFEDDGPGVPADLLEAIFRPFFTTKDPRRHAGLGLAVSRSLLEEHHGEISAACGQGCGATFYVEIPITMQQ